MQTFFREERMPIEEGWAKSKTLITRTMLGALIPDIVEASNWTATTACGPIVLGPGTVLNFAH